MVIPADWKEVRLGEICEFVKTIALSRSQLEADHGVGCTHYGDIHTKFNDRLDCSNVRLPMAEAGLVVGIPRLKVGDLVIADASEDMTGVGKGIEILGIPEYGVVAGLHTAVLRPQVGYFSKGFLGQLQHMPKFREQARVLASGLKVYGLSKTSISKISVDIPPLKEQEAIAEALSDADSAIESLDDLIAKKRDVKQATMQQLLTGRTRLPGFTADWKEVRLGECLTIMHGKNQSQVVDPEGRYPILATGGVIGRTNSYLSNKPSVLIGRKGTIDRPQYMDTPFWTVDTLFYSEVKNGNYAKFLFYKFLMVDWKKYNEASGVPSLNASTIENVEMMVPPLKEQEAIAEALTVMDDELEALTEQVSKLRMVKEGMMQDLLTGKVRLV